MFKIEGKKLAGRCSGNPIAAAPKHGGKGLLSAFYCCSAHPSIGALAHNSRNTKSCQITCSCFQTFSSQLQIIPILILSNLGHQIQVFNNKKLSKSPITSWTQDSNNFFPNPFWFRFSTIKCRFIIQIQVSDSNQPPKLLRIMGRKVWKHRTRLKA